MWFIPTSIHSKPHVIPHEGAYKLGPVLMFRCGLYLLVYLQNPILSPEGAYKSGSVLLFRCGLWLPVYPQDPMISFMKTLTDYGASATVQIWLLLATLHSNFHVISHESKYTLRSVLLFRCGLCLPLYLQNSMLSLMKVLMNQRQCYCSASQF